MQRMILKYISLAILAGAFLPIAVPAGMLTPVQQAKLLADDGAASDLFGNTVALSDHTVVVGAPFDDDFGSLSGAAYVYVRNGKSWVQQAKLLPDDGAAGDEFGDAVAVSGDTVVIGAWHDDDLGSNSGAAYVFVRDGTNWVQQAKLIPDDGTSSENFGDSVAVSGDVVLIGARFGRSQTVLAGSAYVFVRNGTIWSQQAELTPDHGSPNNHFGISVALSGDTAVIGADSHHHTPTDTGSAYVFVRSGTIWSQQTELLANDGGDTFGLSVAVSGDSALIGDRLDFPAGAAYVFVRNGTNWSQQTKLLASDGAVGVGGFFGFSVALSNNTALIGAYQDDELGTESGSAYIFSRDGTTWTEQSKLLANDGVFGDRFGTAVALSSTDAIVGASWDDDLGRQSGSAYVFSLIPSPQQLLRRSTDSRWFAYVVNFDDTTITIEEKGFLSLTRNTAFETVSRGDFNGDGKPDILLRDVTGTENGRWVMALLSGNSILSEGFVDLTRNANWKFIATRDFDGDGKADVLLRNSVDGRWLMYLLDAQSVKSQGIVAMSTNAGDLYVDSADFNGDRRDDILLRRADGSWLLYTLDGLNPPVAGMPAMTTNIAFSVLALDDFNADNRADVLMRRADGRWFLYLMDGAIIADSGVLAMSENTAFGLMSTADFNGDGNADVLLRRTDGRWHLYTLNGLAIGSHGSLPMTRNTAFQIVSAEDFSGDGMADLLMRRTDGRWVLYAIDGNSPSVLKQGIPDMTRNEAWVPQLE